MNHISFIKGVQMHVKTCNQYNETNHMLSKIKKNMKMSSGYIWRYKLKQTILLNTVQQIYYF